MGRNSILALVLVLAVTGVGGYALYDHYQQKAESRPVDAVVTYSGTWEGEESTHLELEYRYTVDGKTYTSTNVCPGIGDGDCYGPPEEVAARYEEGESVTAYVDPDDPSRAFLIEKGTPYPLYLMTGAGAFFTLLVLRDVVSDDPDWKD